MKKSLVLVAVVIGVHCAAISALLLFQGCKTTKSKGATEATTAPMPPLTPPEATPAAVEPSTPAIKEVKEEGTIEYTVKKGDSLGLIAKKHNISKSELMELNKLADPNKIRVGQKLIIPKRAHTALPPAAKTHEAKPKARKNAEKAGEKTEKGEPTPSLAAGINEYVVQAGDSLSKISAKFNVKVSELREVNKLANDKLKLGQKLILPGAKKDEAPEAPAKPEAAPAATTPPPAAAPAVAPAPAAAPVAPAAAPAKTTPGSGITHVVSPNEDLSSIAKLYAVTVDDIVAANQMGTNRTVQAGQKIMIP